jgi:hypothetical protein
MKLKRIYLDYNSILEYNVIYSKLLDSHKFDIIKNYSNRIFVVDTYYVLYPYYRKLLDNNGYYTFNIYNNYIPHIEYKWKKFNDNLNNNYLNILISNEEDEFFKSLKLKNNIIIYNFNSFFNYLDSIKKVSE